MDSSDSPESDRLNKRCFPTPGPATSWWHDAVDGLNKGQVNIWKRMEASVFKNTHIHIYLYHSVPVSVSVSVLQIMYII